MQKANRRNVTPRVKLSQGNVPWASCPCGPRVLRRVGVTGKMPVVRTRTFWERRNRQIGARRLLLWPEFQPRTKMHPTLFTIGSFQIGTYGLMLAVGLYCALVLVSRRSASFGIPQNDIPSLALWIVFAGIVGARIVYLVLDWREFLDSPKIIFSRGGFVFYGGFLGGLVATILWARGRRISFWNLSDLIAPAIPLAHGFGRIGCFLNGCCGGMTTTLPFPFGVQFPGEIGRDVPTQLYSSLFNFLLFGFLIVYSGKRRFAGQVFLAYVVGYSVFRFLIEFLRINLNGKIGPISTTQILCVIALAVFPFLYHRLSRRPITSESVAPAK